MRSAPTTSAIRWPVFVLLAVPAIAIALAITFAADHSVAFGLTVFGVFGLGTAVAGAITVRLLPDPPLRIRAVIRAVVAAVAGTVSLLGLTWAIGPGIDAAASAAALTWIVAGGLLALGAVDLSTWMHARRRDRAARDWLASAMIHALGAAAALLVPANFFLPYVVRDKDVVLPLELTASIMVVGITGAILAVLGVYLMIAGLSLLPARRQATASATDASGDVATETAVKA